MAGATEPARPRGPMGRSACPSRRDAPLRRLDAWRLAGLLGVVRRPRSVAEPVGLVPLDELEQRLEREGALVDARADVTELRVARRHGAQGEVAELGVGHLVPGQRGTDTRRSGRGRTE